MTCGGPPLGFILGPTPYLGEETDEFIQKKNEVVLLALQDSLSKQFPELELSFNSQVFGTSIRMKIVSMKAGPKFDELKKACFDMEDNISYPEISITLCQFIP